MGILSVFGVQMIFASGIGVTGALFLPLFSRMLLLLIKMSVMRCSVASSRLSMAALRVDLGSLANELEFKRALARWSCFTRKAE